MSSQDEVSVLAPPGQPAIQLEVQRDDVTALLRRTSQHQQSTSQQATLRQAA
jgi:hypothetical protein